MITPIKPDPKQPGVGPTGDSPRTPTGKTVQPTGVGGHPTDTSLTTQPIHATGGTLMQSQEDTQRALVAGETRSRHSVEAEIMLWISECHASLPPADSVHWTTHLRSRIPLLMEKLGA